MRPASIVSFDRLYLVAIGLGLIHSILGMDHTRAIIAADPRAIALNIVEPLAYASLALSVAVPLLLWFLVAHRASSVAKWILVAFTLLGLSTLPGSLRQLGAGGGLGILMSLAIEALRVVALTFLFREDAKIWFGKASASDAQG